MAVSDERSVAGGAGSVRAGIAAARAALTPGRWRAHDLGRAPAAIAASTRAAFIAEQDRWFLWTPALLALGIGVYFALPFEPGWALALMAPAIGAAGAWFSGFARPAWLFVSLALAITGAGFAGAKLRTTSVAAPKIEARMGPVSVVGRVEALDVRANGRVAVTLRVAEIDGLAPAEIPVRIRVTAAASLAPTETGSAVDLFAVLMPPPRPVAPGAYDFARRSYFAGIGAYGYTLARPRPAVLPPAGLAARSSVWLEALAESVAGRVMAIIPGSGGAIAAALLTGQRGAIPAADLEAIRDSGLAHLLAISGLHMALMAGAAFWAVRFAIALFPVIALRTDGRKWAAAAGLVTGFGYFLLAGGSVATERAFIMVAIALIAIMLDRPAVSLRNVALAGIAILLARPESLMEAGFQMSFGAVIALTAFYERFGRGERTRAAPDANGDAPAMSAAGLAFRIAAGTLLTTLIASLATGPVAAFHFNRIAVYGLAANLVAVPLVGFVVMPLGLLALIAMPFGLDAPFLGLMGVGTNYLVEIARLVASWPGAVMQVATPMAVSLPLYGFGLLWLALWRWRWRFAGLGVMALAAALAGRSTGPDILVEDEGRRIAVRGPAGTLTLSPGRAARFEAEAWLRRDGDERSLAEAARGTGSDKLPAAGVGKVETSDTERDPSAPGRDPPRATGLRCDPRGCRAELADGVIFAHLRHASALEDCLGATIVISAIPVRGRCRGPAIVIDRFDLYRDGAHAIRLGSSGPKAASVAAAIGDRPWARRPPFARKVGSAKGGPGAGGSGQ